LFFTPVQPPNISVKKNHEGISGGMGCAGVHHIFNRSLHKRGIGICYTKYLGDGESKTYLRVVAGKPYDPNKIRIYRTCTEMNWSKTEETCERKERKKIA
jgi:hypothetical protein